jgi:hypothetical protein
VDGLDGSGCSLVDRFEESDRLQLTFASVKLRNDLARLNVERCKERPSPLPFVLVLEQAGFNISPGRAGLVAEDRVRGCMDVISSRDTIRSSSTGERVYTSHRFSTSSRNASSRGTFGLSQ